MKRYRCLYVTVAISLSLNVYFVLVNETVPTSPTHAQSPQPCPSFEGLEETKGTKRPFTIIVEGSTAVGKSTLLRMIERLGQDVMTILEPMDYWTDVGGVDLQQLEMEDPVRWIGALVMETIYGHVKVALEKPVLPNGRQARVVIRERSIYSMKACYGEHLLKARGISVPEFHLVSQWYNLTMETYHDTLKPDLISKLIMQNNTYCFVLNLDFFSLCSLPQSQYNNNTPTS